MFRQLTLRCLFVLGAVVAACSSEENSKVEEPADAVPAECADIAVDRFKSLAIVDESVVTDPRSNNAANGPWSFRKLIEEMAPPGMTGEQLVREWLETWRTATKINNFRVDARLGVDSAVICPWLRRTPANECDAQCRSCSGNTLDLSQAPFRLIGLANRMDLRETEAPGTAGEARFVYAMTNGAADDPAATVMNGTIILEYKLPYTGQADIKMWAERFHALSAHASFDDAYKAELQALTDSFSKRGASSEGVGGSALNQLRVNEKLFDWQWDLREYKLGANGLYIAPVFRSPDQSMYNSEALATWVKDNQAAILKRQHVTPPSLTGGQSQPLNPIPQSFTGVDPKVRSIFAQETCAGCHQLDASVVDENFQYSPYRKGIARLAPFLNGDGRTDELAHRTRALQRGLCGF